MSIRRRPLFVYMSLNSSAITGITLCNTHLAFVKDQLITYYKTMYQTKSRKEDAMALQGITSSFRRFLDRVEAVEREHKRPSSAASNSPNVAQTAPAGTAASAASSPPATAPIHGSGSAAQSAPGERRSAYSLGLGGLMKAVRDHSAEEHVPSQLAAWLLAADGNSTFMFSDEFAYLPVPQGRAFLEGREIMSYLRKSASGAPDQSAATVRAALLDYIHRPLDAPFEDMHWWTYLSRYELRARRTSKRARDQSDMTGQKGMSNAHSAVVTLAHR
jgi:hypothetical protein